MGGEGEEFGVREMGSFGGVGLGARGNFTGFYDLGCLVG